MPFSSGPKCSKRFSVLKEVVFCLYHVSLFLETLLLLFFFDKTKQNPPSGGFCFVLFLRLLEHDVLFRDFVELAKRERLGILFLVLERPDDGLGTRTLHFDDSVL